MSDAAPTKRTWTGGAYPEREGVEVTATADGIRVEAWYDGGINLEFEFPFLSWDELSAMREAAEKDAQA